MSAPIRLPLRDVKVLSELHWRYETTTSRGMRTRYQILLLASGGQTVPHIARMVFCDDDTVLRVLKCFLSGGLDAIARQTSSGRPRTVTPAWESELVRVMERDPHDVGVLSANWTTELLADYLGRQTGIWVTPETVRLYLHAHGYVCKRPIWSLRRKAGEQAGYVGKRLRIEVLLAGAAVPEPLPFEFLVEAELWSELPADVPELLALLPRADLYLQDEVQLVLLQKFLSSAKWSIL